MRPKFTHPQIVVSKAPSPGHPLLSLFRASNKIRMASPKGMRIPSKIFLFSTVLSNCAILTGWSCLFLGRTDPSLIEVAMFLVAIPLRGMTRSPIEKTAGRSTDRRRLTVSCYAIICPYMASVPPVLNLVLEFRLCPTYNEIPGQASSGSCYQEQRNKGSKQPKGRGRESFVSPSIRVQIRNVLSCLCVILFDYR
jgi:hypothetical protein